MTLASAREAYGVPAHAGGRVTVSGDRHGVIVEASGPNLRVLVDGNEQPVTVNPARGIAYHLPGTDLFGDAAATFVPARWSGDPRTWKGTI